MGFAFSLPLFFGLFGWLTCFLHKYLYLVWNTKLGVWGEILFFTLTHVVGFGDGEFDEEDN
jgi:hypothetical protein